MLVRKQFASRRQVTSTASVAAPVGGLNARDALANMDPEDAVILENWFPTPTSVDIRNGYESHATGLPDWVETLMNYNSPTDQELFAISDGDIFDVSSAGAVGVAVVSNLTNSRFQYINVGTAGGAFLLAVNGADKLQGYNGTTWWEDGDGTHDITGFDTSDAIHINEFKNRVWFIEKESFKAWFLGVDAIAGAANDLDLAPLFKLGGYLMVMCNWTIDNAAGIDDYAAFISSEGEVALYKGTDPTSATDWFLVGTFRIGRPVGRRCVLKVGADVIVICADGVFPLSKALLTDRTQLQESISDKIVNLINTDVKSYSDNFGWQPILYPIGNKLIINVPQVENSTQYQYVMNTITGAWCKFTGWDAACWEFFNDGIYFGGDMAVYQADVGLSDNGADITADALPAFSYFKQKSREKMFMMARPVFTAEGIIRAAIAMCVDFNIVTPTSTPSFTGSGGSIWNVAPWNTSFWLSGFQTTKSWITVNGVGYAGALRTIVTANQITIRWQSTDYAFESGGIL